jgi:hypothetical protein
VRGVDDRFWTLFGSAFTVYGGCRVNLSAITNVQLIAAILFLSVPENKRAAEPMLQDPQKLFALAGLVAKAKQFGMQFKDTAEFIEFVKDPAAKISALAGETTMAGSQASGALSSGALGALTGGQKLGMVEIAEVELKKIAKVEARRTYRVQAWGEIDRNTTSFPPIRSTITGVWDTKGKPDNAKKRKPETPDGTWVFLRED